MALTSRQQLLVLVKRLHNALSLSPFLLLNLLASGSAKWLILLQTEARTINSLSKLTKAL